MNTYRVSWATKPGIQPVRTGTASIQAPTSQRARGFALDTVSDVTGIPYHHLRVRAVTQVTRRAE